MMNLKELSDYELVEHTKDCVLKERKATLLVLDRLREIIRRGVHLSMGYGSLHEFCISELGYSDGAAHRRIQAMRLCDEMPKAKEAIADGSLSLSTAASLEAFLKKEGRGLSDHDKQEIMRQSLGKSKTELERLYYPEGGEKTLAFNADEETQEDLHRLCELMAISPGDLTTLIKRTARIARKTIDPLMKKPRSGARQKNLSAPASLEKCDYRNTDKPAKSELSTSPEKLANQELSTSPEKLTGQQLSTSPEKLTRPRPKRTHIPAATRRAVWLRDQSQCIFTDMLTGHRCGSRFGLQVDHRIPVACGGTNDLENLRLLCFAHNQFAADRVYGRAKMAKYRIRTSA